MIEYITQKVVDNNVSIERYCRQCKKYRSWKMTEDRPQCDECRYFAMTMDDIRPIVFTDMLPLQIVPFWEGYDLSSQKKTTVTEIYKLLKNGNKGLKVHNTSVKA